jgi:Skp family chaperone for outer membrane proteins
MKTTIRGLLIVCLALAMTAPLLAQDKGKGKGKARNRRADAAVTRAFQLPPSITLSAEQQEKLAALKKELVPKLTEANKKLAENLTDEQKKARREAAQAARQAGKKGKELQQAVEEAMKLTPEQQAAMTKARKELASVTQEVRTAVRNLLTDEQRAQLPQPKKGAKGKKKNAA